MKITDCLEHVPMTGPCKVNVDSLIRCFGKSYVYSWHSDYRFVNQRLGIKIDISCNTADQIIRRMKLVGREHPLFAPVTMYTKAD